MKWCDLKCKYAEWPDEFQDGSCRTFVGLYCKKKKMVVYKNQPCKDKKDEDT
jgi:hypothetical protein